MFTLQYRLRVSSSQHTVEENGKKRLIQYMKYIQGEYCLRDGSFTRRLSGTDSYLDLACHQLTRTQGFQN